jgi:hypothetical protein
MYKAVNNILLSITILFYPYFNQGLIADLIFKRVNK